jgi:hypothetical protein
MQPPIPSPTEAHCPNCGQPLELRAAFCPRCGARLQQVSAGLGAWRVIQIIVLSLVALASGTLGGCFLIVTPFMMAGEGASSGGGLLLAGLVGVAIAVLCLRSIIKMLRSR